MIGSGQLFNLNHLKWKSKSLRESRYDIVFLMTLPCARLYRILSL